MRKNRQSLKQQTFANFKEKYNSDNEVINYIAEIQKEANRVEQIMIRTPEIIDDINRQFLELTGLKDKDIKLLFIAVGLQCLRQYIFSNDAFRLTASQGDELAGSVVPKKWHDILLGSVPYDAIRKSIPDLETGLSGYTHRYRTLGHDPLFGWVFGPVNIITDSLTKSDFVTTYAVSNMTICDYYYNGTLGSFNDCINAVSAEKLLLPVSVMRQAMHFGSDYFTKQGLPIPLLPSLNNDFAKFLTVRCNIDMYSVMRGAALSSLINSIIFYTHSIFYDKNLDHDMDLYEVRTRKILMYSNIISSASNIIYVSIKSFLGDYSSLKKLDVGGILVAIYRILNDSKQIALIQEEFIANQFNKMIMNNQ